jgi:hypothetical protein
VRTALRRNADAMLIVSTADLPRLAELEVSLLQP